MDRGPPPRRLHHTEVLSLFESWFALSRRCLGNTGPVARRAGEGVNPALAYGVIHPIDDEEVSKCRPALEQQFPVTLRDGQGSRSIPGCGRISCEACDQARDQRTRSQRCEHSLPRGRALSTIDDSLGLRATLALDCAPPERAKVNSASEDAHTL